LGAGLNAVERGRGVGAFYSLGEGGEAVAGVGGLLMSPVTGRRSESGTGEGSGQGSHAGRGMGEGLVCLLARRSAVAGSDRE
jgi:hypothetical protein